jgi:hypothetical protein
MNKPRLADGMAPIGVGWLEQPCNNKEPVAAFVFSTQRAHLAPEIRLSQSSWRMEHVAPLLIGSSQLVGASIKFVLNDS